MNCALSRRVVRNIDCSSLNRYWHDAAYRRRMDNENDHQRRLNMDAMDAAMIANGTRWPVDWCDDDKAGMTAKLRSVK
jgi:hypothetical protein